MTDMKESFVFLANGFEEIEALATVDVLRRAGMDITTVSIHDGLTVTGAHGIPVTADATISDVDTTGGIDWLICPGGMPGAEHLANCRQLTDLLKKHHSENGRIAAICAAPAVVLAPLGILSGKKATCYPGFENALAQGDATATGNRVETDGNVITGNGPSSAIPFALAIVKETLGQAVCNDVSDGMLC